MARKPHAPTTIFRAARIVTMTSDEPEAFAVTAGRIAATGRYSALTQQFPGVETVDFGDLVVAPGFNDAHMHITMTAEDLLHLDLSSSIVRSLADLKQKIAAEAAAQPAGSWIRGSRYDDGKMAEGRLLTRADLDEVAPHHPVLVTHVSAHWGVINSAAMRLGGLSDESAPPEGGELGRDPAGRLNGILYEQVLFDFAYPQISHTGRTVAPVSALEDRLAGLRRACALMHAAGITSVGEALVGPGELDLLAEASRRRILTLRTNLLLAAEHYDSLRPAIASLDAAPEMLRVGGIKTFVDGAVGGRTCLVEQPFEGTSDNYGMQTRSAEELEAAIATAHRDNVRICVHANGDRAIKLILDLLERAQERQALGPAPRIEHCSIVDEDILRRMKRLSAIAVPFGSYVHYHGGRLIDWYGNARVSRMFAHRWFLDSGITVAGSSDFPCGPYEPLLAMRSCVTRLGWDGQAVGANQRITRREALAVYTVQAAAAAGEQAYKGRLAPGYLADFAVLGGDPLTSEPEHLAAIPVHQTYVAGQQVWAA